VFTLELDFTFRFLRWLCVDADEAELEDSELSEDETTEEELSLEIGGGHIFLCFGRVNDYSVVFHFIVRRVKLWGFFCSSHRLIQ